MYLYALKLLRTKDYSVSVLRQKIENKFGSAPEELIQQLLNKRFLNDRRFAQNYVDNRKDRGRALIREELLANGIAADLVDDVVSKTDWPSLRQAVTAKMNGWKLRAPLQSRDAARLFRALLRLGYEEDAIREEIENLHEQ